MKRIIQCSLVLLVIGLVLVGCGKKKEITLVGEWDYSGFVYKFNEDKTGSYTAGGTEMTFTYEDDGEKVTILYDGNTNSSTYEYRIEDGKLIIKDSFGKDVVYNRK